MRTRALLRRFACAAMLGVLWAASLATLGSVAGASSSEVWNSQGVAVIIGNRDYEHRDVPDVTFAHRDADAFRGYVIDVLGYDPENIIDLRDASRRELFDAFGTRATLKGLLWSYLDPRGGSEVVVFYSGHGVPGVHDGRGYLLPVDADPKAAEDDGYPIDLLYENLGGLAEAETVRVYLDACFSGSSADGALIKDASPVYVTAALPEGAGEKVVSLSAASGKQIASWDRTAKHGLFTHHLLDALHGGGDGDGDGRVTAEEAKAYLDRHMTRAARREHRRVQEASLIGGAGVVLSVAPVDGEFPVRRGSDASAPAPAVAEAEDGDGGGAVADPALDLAAVTGGEAILTVETTPAGASVLVAGAEVGETPLRRYDLRAGTYTVTLDHPTHETVALKDQTLADAQVLRIERTLVPATGKVTVITQPEGAWVEHEGERLSGTTPVTLDGLPSGPLVLTLGAEGHRPERVEVEVQKGGVVLVNRVLEEVRHGTLTLTLEPADARVTLADGGTPYRPGMELEEGEYRIRVAREGYKAASRVVTVSGETRLPISLERAPQPFTVMTTPADAEVRFLDGRGSYRAGMALKPGSYRVRVSAAGWETQEATIRHGTAPTRHVVRLKRERDPAAEEAALDLDREDRRRIQRSLASLGFDPGPADGLFGSGTRQALETWQFSEELEPTGYLDAAAAKLLLAVSEATLESFGPDWIIVENQPCQIYKPSPELVVETATWTGPCVDGKGSGHGRTVWRRDWEKSIYEGERRNGMMHGQGTYTHGLSAFQGEWHHNVLPEGTHFFDGELKYSGQFTLNLTMEIIGDILEPHGRGTQYIAEDFRYTGDFRDGKQHGRGTLVWPRGRRYEGEWRNGKPHGYGTYTTAGKVYRGDWRNGCFSTPDDGWALIATTKEACGFE